MKELENGRTIVRAIELSRKTKVVLDRHAVFPLTRLWCLYEIGTTPPHKLELVTQGFNQRDIAKNLQSIDAETAHCFSDDDRKMIRAEIIARFNSLDRFTQELRLRFLLRPISYDGDVAALRNRAASDTCHFDDLREHVKGDMRMACVVGAQGEGKSTIAAAMLGAAGDGLIHAAHFCKRTDATRQDTLKIIHSLAYQLSECFEHIRSHILSIDSSRVQDVQVDVSIALKELMLKPFQLLAASQRTAVVLIDALDEADGQATNNVLELLRR